MGSTSTGPRGGRQTPLAFPTLPSQSVSGTASTSARTQLNAPTSSPSPMTTDAPRPRLRACELACLLILIGLLADGLTVARTQQMRVLALSLLGDEFLINVQVLVVVGLSIPGELADQDPDRRRPRRFGVADRVAAEHQVVMVAVN